MNQIWLSKEADPWMETAVEEFLLHNVVLACYEKDLLHCPKSKRLHIPIPSQPVGDSLELEAEK